MGEALSTVSAELIRQPVPSVPSIRAFRESPTFEQLTGRRVTLLGGTPFHSCCDCE
jgi:hypothetical protein